MTMTANIAATRLSAQVLRVEQTLDSLLLQQAQLVSTVVQAGLDVAAPMMMAQPTLLRLARCQQSLVDARSDLIHAHEEMRKVGEERADIMVTPCPTKQELSLVDESIAA